MKFPYALALISLVFVSCATEEPIEPPVEDPVEEVSSELVMAPFAFTLPEGWVAEIQMDGVYITMVDEEATLFMTLEATAALPTPEAEVTTTEEGIQIYNIGCGGPYYCGNLAYEDQAYDYTFDFRFPEAEGRVAEDSSLIAPESILTQEELEAFIATVHLAK